MSGADGPLRRRFDGAALLGFALLAALFHLGRHSGGAIDDLGSDAANIASFAAAYDHPENFEKDAALGRVENFRFYATAHIPLIRAIRPWIDGYGEAMSAMIGPHVFLHLAGFYLFGILLLRSRPWALALALAMLSRIYLTHSLWGVYPDPIPRLGFSALTGFYLAGALWTAGRLNLQLALMASVGLSMYVHPVSAPIFALGLWAGLWIGGVPNQSIGRRLLHLFLCGLCFLAVAGPFVWHYLSHHDHGVVSNPELIREIMEYRYMRGFVSDRLWGILDTLRILSFKVPILPFAAVFAIAAFGWGDDEDRKGLKRIGLWTLGATFASAGLFLIDHAVCEATGRIPAQVDLVRGIRFWVPFGLAAWAYSLVALGRRPLAPRWELLRKAGVACFAAFAILSSPTYLRTMAQGALRFASSETPTEEASWVDAVEDHVPPDASIFVFRADALAVRYATLRSVVFSKKDGGVLSYANLEALPAWYEIALRADSVESIADPSRRAKEALALGRSLGADFILADTETFDPNRSVEGCPIVWSGDAHTLCGIVVEEIR